MAMKYNSNEAISVICTPENLNCSGGILLAENKSIEPVIEWQDCTFFNFVLWGLVGSCFCILGMIGNALSITSFQKDRRTAAVTLLQCLACSDFVLLFTVFVTDDIPYACDYSPGCENFWVSTSTGQDKFIYLLAGVRAKSLGSPMIQSALKITTFLKL